MASKCLLLFIFLLIIIVVVVIILNYISCNNEKMKMHNTKHNIESLKMYIHKYSLIM